MSSKSIWSTTHITSKIQPEVLRGGTNLPSISSNMVMAHVPPPPPLPSFLHRSSSIMSSLHRSPRSILLEVLMIINLHPRVWCHHPKKAKTRCQERERERREPFKVPILVSSLGRPGRLMRWIVGSPQKICQVCPG